jgi:hypothetical protein
MSMLEIRRKVETVITAKGGVCSPDVYQGRRECLMMAVYARKIDFQLVSLLHCALWR